MSKIRTHAIRELEVKKVPFTLLEHGHKARHAQEAASERGVPLQQVVKTLLVRRPDGRHVIALVRGDQRLSLKKLARLVEAVAPLGLRRHDVPIYVDHHIVQEPRVSISAGRHDTGLELSSEDLVRAVDGRVADLTE